MSADPGRRSPVLHGDGTATVFVSDQLLRSLGLKGPRAMRVRSIERRAECKWHHEGVPHSPCWVWERDEL